MKTVRLTVDLAKITDNARRTLELCEARGLELVGVCKAVRGSPEIARAMLAGGIRTLADSRLDNIVRLREGGIGVPVILIRSPGLSEIAECVAHADGSLNSQAEVLLELAAAATRLGKRHAVILMVDLQTGREGCAPEELGELARLTASVAGLDLQGVGTYFDFQSEADFQLRTLGELVTLVRRVEAETGLSLPVVSGGSTMLLDPLVLSGDGVSGVNQLRLGTAILLGIHSSVGPQRIPGFHQDTFVVDAELIEIQHRDGIRGLLSMGEIDVDPDYLFPVHPAVTVVRGTSDHLIVDLTEAKPVPQLGDRLAFSLGYYSLCRLTASPYVQIVHV